MAAGVPRRTLRSSERLRRLLAIGSKRLCHATSVLAVVLILKVTTSIVLGFVDYLPPDFRSDFLRGRQHYFWHGYHLAFYVHIFSSPLALLVGTVLMSDAFRMRYPCWHRYLGRAQAVGILLLVVPSGIWMSAYSQGGRLAALGFASLAIATGGCVSQGWRCAVQKRLSAHRMWMTRCFVLLCSAVVLRLIGGVFAVAGVDAAWSYELAAWLSWIVPLAGLELIQRLRKILATVD